MTRKCQLGSHDAAAENVDERGSLSSLPNSPSLTNSLGSQSIPMRSYSHTKAQRHKEEPLLNVEACVTQESMDESSWEVALRALVPLCEIMTACAPLQPRSQFCHLSSVDALTNDE